MKVIDVTKIGPFIRALHCPTRWKIIELLQEGPKSSDDIYQELSKENKDLKKPTLYYHLRELESVEIIGLDEYKPSDQGRAPEKVWKLLIEKLNIDFMKKEEH